MIAPATQPEASPTFDEPAIREHVMMIHQLAAGLIGKFVVSAFFANPNGEDKAGGVISHHPVGDVDGTVEAIMAHAATPNANVYLCPNLTGNVPLHIKIGSTVIQAGGDSVRITAGTIVLDGEVHLGGEGGQLLHRKGDLDSDGDTAVGSASRVYAV